MVQTLSRVVRSGRTLVLIILSTMLVGLTTPTNATDSNAYTESQAYFPSSDGTILHAWIWRPAAVPPAERTPVLLFVGPYSGGLQRRAVGGDPVEPQPPGVMLAGRAFERGYTVVEVDLRGTGASGGCVDLGGPGEQADARMSVEWAASQPWSNGRVGMGGGSYVGWTQFMAAADPPDALKAIAPVSGVVDPYRDNLYTNGVAHQNLQTGLALTYLALGLVPPGPEEGPEGPANQAGGILERPDCLADNLAPTMFDHDRSAPYYVERDLVPHLQNSHVPMFITHGFADFRVRPASLLEFWPTVRGAQRAWFGQWGHAGPNPRTGAAGRTGWTEELMAFYDRHVKGEPPAAGDPLSEVTVQEGDGRWRAERNWPPSDTRATSFPVKPGWYDDLGNPIGIDQFTEDGAGNQAEANEVLLTTDPERLEENYWPVYGMGSWTFTEPFPHEAHIAGRVRVEVDVDTVAADVPLVALLYDVDEDDQAWFVTRGAHLLPASGRYLFDLMPQDWRVRPGHRLGLLLTNNDQLWFNTVNTNTRVEVHAGSFTAPFLRHHRDRFLEGTSNSYVEAQRPIPLEPAAIVDSTVRSQLPPRQASSGCWQSGRC